MLRKINPMSILCLLLLWFTAGCTEETTVRTSAPPEDTAAVEVAPDEAAETSFFEIGTPLGRMVIRLYDETPQHRDNFAKLAGENFYDGTTFHRVIEGFMIQGGDPNSRDGDPRTDGSGGPGYTLPAEIVPGLFHRRGALAAARTGDQMNPERRSSGSQFYIVHGTTFEADELSAIEQQISWQTRNPEFSFSEQAREVYMTEGGSPHLDGQYTIFGELVDGFDVLDRIASQPKTPHDPSRPVEPPTITVRPLRDYQEQP